MKKFCIVIPIYKEDLDPIDKLSLERLHKVIKNKYDIYLVKSNELDAKKYYNILKQKNVYEVIFDKKYFEGTASYSQLCLQYDFYDKFSDYEYMYIYQTDCYLVEDKLEEWCNKEYEYIGAPIISSNAGWKNYRNPDKYEPQVGNGGFSLRKIEVFKDITNPEGEFRKKYNLTDEQLSKVVFEDKYFMNDIYDFYEIITPHWIEALSFGMDMNIDVIYNTMKYQGLPMGIHAWGKNIRYWQNVLEELKDNKEVIDFCEDKYQEFFKVYYQDPQSLIKEYLNKLKIYICAYNNYGKENVPNEEYYEYINDDDCNNKLNDNKLLYSEYYHIYDILTNKDLPDYVGICHYKRYIDFNLNDIQNLENKKYDIILPKPYKFGINNYLQYIYNFDAEFLERIKKIIKEYYPEYLESYEYFLQDEKLYSNSIMITNKEIFIDYCNFVFDIFDKFLTDININTIEDMENYIDNNSNHFNMEGIMLSDIKAKDNDKYLEIRHNFSRVCGFLGERLLNVYILKNNLKVLEKDMIIYDKK